MSTKQHPVNYTTHEQRSLCSPFITNKIIVIIFFVVTGLHKHNRLYLASNDPSSSQGISWGRGGVGVDKRKYMSNRRFRKQHLLL